MLTYMDPEDTIDIVLDCDADNPTPTVFVCHLVSPALHARMSAMVEKRRQAHLETGGRPTDEDAAEKAKETECTFLSKRVIKEILNMPVVGDITEPKNIARALAHCIPVLDYDDLVNKIASGQGIAKEPGKN